MLRQLTRYNPNSHQNPRSLPTDVISETPRAIPRRGAMTFCTGRPILVTFGVLAIFVAPALGQGVEPSAFPPPPPVSPFVPPPEPAPSAPVIVVPPPITPVN